MIEEAIRVIDNVTSTRGITSAALALRLVRFKVGPLTRRDSERVMMFITDGEGITGVARKEAQYIREKEAFRVFAIGKDKVCYSVYGFESTVIQNNKNRKRKYSSQSAFTDLARMVDKKFQEMGG